MINANAYDCWDYSTDWLERERGLRLHRDSLANLAQIKRGPPRPDSRFLTYWANAFFFADEECRPASEHRTETPYVNLDDDETRLRWLVMRSINDGPDAYSLREELKVFGCDVLHAEHPISALRAAAEGEYHAAILWPGRNFDSIDSAVCITDWFHSRGKPYIYVTAMEDVPPTIRHGGVVTRGYWPDNFGRLVATRFPPVFRENMRLYAPVDR
jgi:hypothetical protein